MWRWWWRLFMPTPSRREWRRVLVAAGGAELALAAPVAPSLVPLLCFLLASLLLLVPPLFFLLTFCLPPFCAPLPSEFILPTAVLLPAVLVESPLELAAFGCSCFRPFFELPPLQSALLFPSFRARSAVPLIVSTPGPCCPCSRLSRSSWCRRGSRRSSSLRGRG